MEPTSSNISINTDDINAIVAAEKQRRADAYQNVASSTGELSSSSYGKLSLNTDGTFKWSGYKLLVPAVISAGAKTAGTCSVKYAVSKELAASYDGVLTFKFEGTTDEVNFLYKLENDGLRLEAANDATYNGILVTGRSSSPLIMYFR